MTDRQGYGMLVADCAACGALLVAHPARVPSIRLGPDGQPSPTGDRCPICRACFDRWNHEHRTSKGLAPVRLLPGAYCPAPEGEL